METVNALNKEKLPEVAKKSTTAYETLKDFASRSRMRWETDVERYALKLASKGIQVIPNDYKALWKDLEAIGAGAFIHGRGGRPDRFRWYYSLKDIGIGAIEPGKLENIVPVDISKAPKAESTPKKRGRPSKKRRGRPPGSKNRSVGQSENVSIGSGIILTVKDINGRNLSISLQEAIRVAEKVSSLQKVLAA